MGLLHKLLGRNKANQAAEGVRQPDTCADLQLRELQARVAEAIETLDAARARIRELGRRYPHTS